MKYFLIALLVLLHPLVTLAQKHNLFADVGVPSGFSITGTHQFTKRISLGVGVQGYQFAPTMTNKDELVPAVFGDLRINSLQRKKHFFFYFLDFGINFYKANDDNSHFKALFDFVTEDNGFYTGLGIGYFRLVTKHSGPYVSLKIISNCFHDSQYNIKTNELRKIGMLYGVLALSIGYKF